MIESYFKRLVRSDWNCPVDLSRSRALRISLINEQLSVISFLYIVVIALNEQPFDAKAITHSYQLLFLQIPLRSVRELSELAHPVGKVSFSAMYR